MIFEGKEFEVKNGLKILIKSPSVDEAEEILKVHNRILNETEYCLSAPEDPQHTLDEEKTFIEKHETGESYFLCVYVDGNIIGMSNLNFDRHFRARHRASIGISILKEYWNTGIGSALFEVMIDLAKKHEGTEIITLEYVAGNDRGRGLYQKFGFKPYGVAPKVLKFKDGSYGDEVLMVKVLEK